MLGAVLLGRVNALSPVARAKSDGEGENETSENGARTHDENIFLRCRQWNSSAKASSARSSAALCEIFATLWIFLNRTAIQH
jgi:hypothetical protein